MWPVKYQRVYRHNGCPLPSWITIVCTAKKPLCAFSVRFVPYCTKFALTVFGVCAKVNCIQLVENGRKNKECSVSQENVHKTQIPPAALVSQEEILCWENLLFSLFAALWYCYAHDVFAAVRSVSTSFDSPITLFVMWFAAVTKVTQLTCDERNAITFWYKMSLTYF